MRFWIILLCMLVTLTAIFESSDLMEEVTFNPLGHYVEPRYISEHDSLERHYKQVFNDTPAVWGKVNYGNLDDYSITTTDINGTEGKAVGEAKAIMNMLDNSTAESKVSPAPSGITVVTLPGMQPDNKPLNSFTFNLDANGMLMSPRHYYLNESMVSLLTDNKGAITKPLTGTNPTLNVTVAQVPFSEDHFLTDETGVTTKASDVEKTKAEITKSLNDLSKLAKSKASHQELSNHLFSGNGIASSYNNINTMINSGAYADAYQQGLVIGLDHAPEGQDNYVTTANIKTNNAKDVYSQFDQIYNSLKNRGGSEYFPTPLVDWAQNNTSSIIHTLMVNYMMQSQFSGTDGPYTTPISMNYWTAGGTEFSDFNKKLKSLGKATKEPFYLYTVINPKEGKLVNGTIPLTFSDNAVQPHLSYIFNLYTAIHSQVWVGMSGLNATGSISDVWQASVKAMEKKIKNDKNKKDGIPYNANNTTFRMSEIENNNLVSGLSTGKKSGEDTYPNKELIGALRLMLSSGHHESKSTVSLYGGEFPITKISGTKYDKKFNYNHMYNAFTNSSGNMHSKWVKFVQSAINVPIQPLVLRSYWDKAEGQGAYIMLPILLGSMAFPDSLGIMLDNLAKSKEDSASGGADYLNMSKANRYIMTFNLEHSKESKTTNTTGVVRVDAGAPMGTAKDKSKPVVITGYLGGETFSIVDYFLTQDALQAGQAKPPLTVKTVKDVSVNLDYLELFEDFFTVRTESDLVGTSGGKVNYVMGFQKQGYMDKYNSSKTIPSIIKISPDYSKFFTGDESEVSGDGQ